MKLLGITSTVASILAAATFAAVTTLTAGSASAAVTGRAVSPVCAGVTNCHFVTSADVNGDGRPDTVGWRQLSDQTVQIRVRLASGHVLVHNVDVHLWWGGGAWGGAAYVDGRPGRELLVGAVQGAHTPMYRMLTFRAGALVVENSPSALSNLWQVDAAYGDDMGWWRHTGSTGQVSMTQKIAVRTEGGDTFTGRNVTFGWTKSGWSRTATSHVRYPDEQAAAKIAGFHVPGLAAFPGMT